MINEQVRDREVRVISSNGEQLGIMSSKEAMKLAREAELDLVKIAPNAKPPVCKIIDYGKYRYELARKEKEAKKAERQTKAKKTKAAAPKGAKAETKTKAAAPATPVEVPVEGVASVVPEQPERKKRTRIEKKEKVATAAVPVQKNEEAAVSKKPVSANAPVSEALVQAADTTANSPAETVKPAAKKMVKKTDKPVAKPFLPLWWNRITENCRPKSLLK